MNSDQKCYCNVSNAGLRLDRSVISSHSALRSSTDVKCAVFELVNMGRGTSLYKPYRYVPPNWVRFLRRFVLETGIHFAHFGLESGMVFEVTTGMYERTMYHFNSR